MATVGIKGLTRRDLHILIGLQVMRMLTDTVWLWWKSGRTLFVPSVKRKKRLLFISLKDAAHFQRLDLHCMDYTDLGTYIGLYS